VSLIEAIVLGIVQGLTEFLPVSSSAHLILVPWLFGWEEPGLAFDAALHLGTLAAVIVYFWREILGMIRAAPRALTRPRYLLRDPDPLRGRDATLGAGDTEARLLLLIGIGTLPGLLAGLVGQSAVERFYHPGGPTPARAIVAVAIALIVLGGLLWAAERSAAHQRRITHLTWNDVLAIGLAQATALIPGVSRSGATITTGLFQGLHRADAARFSFLLGIPIIAAAGVKGLLDTFQSGLSGQEWAIFAIGVIVSGVSGFIAIWALLRYLQRASTAVFVMYRLGLGILLLILVAAGVR
jgi:undecaprenyl-diphosphatase